jgi:hypothetical protein
VAVALEDLVAQLDGGGRCGFEEFSSDELR